MLEQKYKEPVTIKFPGMVARVHSPILEPAERERRIKNIHRATANMFGGVSK
jgi:hypothetical protein